MISGGQKQLQELQALKQPAREDFLDENVLGILLPKVHQEVFHTNVFQYHITPGHESKQHDSLHII
jgi:hypothetical protein